MNSSGSLSARHGKSLVEMLVVLAIMGIILPSGMIALAGVRKTIRQTQEFNDASRIANDLAVRFRRDVRGANEVSIKDGQQLLLSNGATKIVYVAQDAVIEREERSGDRLVGRESYRLWSTHRAEFQRREETDSVELLVTRETPQNAWRVVSYWGNPRSGKGGQP